MKLMTESEAWAYLAERVATAELDGCCYYFAVFAAQGRKIIGLCGAVTALRVGMISDETANSMLGRLEALPCVVGRSYRWSIHTVEGVRSRVRFCVEMAKLTKANNKETR